MTNDQEIQKAQQKAEGAKLVKQSTLLMLAGLLVMFGGCGSAFAFHAPMMIGVGVIAGIVVLVVAAIVGQIGRAKQGRVI